MPPGHPLTLLAAAATLAAPFNDPIENERRRAREAEEERWAKTSVGAKYAEERRARAEKRRKHAEAAEERRRAERDAW